MSLYRAEHIDWHFYDELVFNDSTFYRKKIPKEKGHFILQNNQLTLYWDNWAPEVLVTNDNHNTYFCQSYKFNLTKINNSLIEKTKPKNIEKIKEKINLIRENSEKRNINENSKKVETSKEFVKKKVDEFENPKQKSKENKKAENTGKVKKLVNNIENQLSGYYINLAIRKDRNKYICDTILKLPFFNKVQRFDAIKDNRRGVGCNQSHIKALECIKKIQNPRDYYIILEDDIRIDNNKFQKFLIKFNQIKDQDNWDVILLGGSYLHVKKDDNTIKQFYRVVRSQTTVGYIVKYNYIQKLINNFQQSMNLFLKTQDYLKYAMDVYWHCLQESDKWYIYKEFFCDQIESYSDIEKKNINYKICYETITYV